MWTAQAKYCDGLKRSILRSISSAFVHRKTYLRALDQLGGDHVDVGVDQRLAAGDRDHRRAALLDRGDRVLDRHPPAQQLVGLLDLAAARAREVALVQRLELDQQREALPPGELLRA